MGLGGIGVIWVLVFWVVPIFVGIAIGRPKRRMGFLYGLFLGWLGVIILALLPPAADPMKGECPFCREEIRLDATVCPHCQRDVQPLVVNQ